MAYYSCTTTDGCSATSITTGTYSTSGACELACIGWGCGPSQDLAPDADILFVFDASGSFPTTSVEEYFKATTAWTQTLTQNGWTGDANWVMSNNLHSEGHFASGVPFGAGNGQVDFYDINGTLQSTNMGSEDFLSWGSIPYTMTNRDASGNKVFLTDNTGGNPFSNLMSCIPGWTNALQSQGPNLYCTNLAYIGNNCINTSNCNLSVLPGIENYFSNYEVRPNLATTGLTFPTNDQLVVTISQTNLHYNTVSGSYPAEPYPIFKNHYRLWDVVRAGGALHGRNYEGYSIPGTYHEPATWDGSTLEDIYGSAGATEQENITRQQMFMAMSKGNQDDTSLTGATGVLDGTWVVIPDGHPLPNGGTCANHSGCSTVPGGLASDNPCVEWSQYNASTPNVYQNTSNFTTATDFNPCYTSVIHRQVNPALANYTEGYVNVHDWHGHNYDPNGLPFNAYWNIGFGDLERKGWKHRYHDNTFNNPQNDLANLLNVEISDAANWTPVTCISAQTDYTLDITYRYSSYTECTGGTVNCAPIWHCDGLGTPCYSAYTSGSTGNWYFDETTCQSNCNLTPIWSCATEGCVSGYTFPGTTYATSALCASDCVGWGCEDVATLTDFYLYVYYDLTSMGVDNIKIAYSAVTDWVLSLPVLPIDVCHVIAGDEEWLRWGVAPFMDSNEMSTWGQSGWGTQEDRLPLIEAWFTGLTPAYQVGSWYDNIDNGINYDVFPEPPHIDGSATGRTLSDNVLNLVFLDETENHGKGGYFNLNQVYQNSELDPLYSYNSVGEPSGAFKDDYELYVSKYAAVTGAGGTITNFIYPTCPTQYLGDTPPLKAMYTYTALHMVASIDSGNQDQVGGTGTLDGTWQVGTEPTSSICSLAELSAQPNPYYDAVNNVSTNSSNYGALDQFGWGYNVGFVGMNSVVLANDLNNFITNSVSVTIVTQFATCLSAETNYLTHPSFSSATELDCWIDCEITGYTCTQYGCIYGVGPGYDYDSLEDCYSGVTGGLPACTSYECTTTGCTLYNEYGNSNYTGSGNLGTGGTYSTSATCTATCSSYGCTDSGCTEYNTLVGTASYVNGNGGTGGLYTTSNCDNLCTSFDCTTTGCTDYNISAGTASYNLFAGSPYQGMGGSGGTYSSTLECSGMCISYECTDYGCVIYNDPDQDWAPGYTNGSFGSGGTFSSLSSCTATCQSFGCEVAGCEEWNSPNNQNSFSYLSADVAPYNLGGNYGTGGTSALTACTATCYTWGCTDTGCSATTGFNLGAWQYDEELQCNQNCTSHNCTISGCVSQPGSGGTWTGNNSGQDCLSSCTSWHCDPLDSNGSSWVSLANGGITTDGPVGHPAGSNWISDANGNSVVHTWQQDSCVEYAGTGHTGTTFYSQEACHSACTSWSCEYPGAKWTTYSYGIPYGSSNNSNQSSLTDSGCLEFRNTGSTYSHLTYDACTAATVCDRYECTDDGCVVGDQHTGTYPSYSACTGGTTYISYRNDDGAINYNPVTVTLPACQSWACGVTGCTGYNDPLWQNSAGYTNGGYGTGGSSTYATCTASCVSYNCTATGCTSEPGFGGTYYDVYSPSNALSLCQQDCYSFVCTDGPDTGCTIYNSFPGTPGYVNGFSGSGGTFVLLDNCDTDCISWNCTSDGCESQIGTGGTYTTKALCTGSCQSWICGITGCTGYNDPLYPNAPQYTDGEYGTGGTIAQSACTADCKTWNCSDNGCVVVIGTLGMYDSYSACTGGTPTLSACSSWDCTSSGCTEYNISAGTSSYTNGLGGTGGTYFSSSCDDLCSSWDCTNSGCTEYNVIGGTASYDLFVGTVYQGMGGSGGTYTSDTCNNICHSYECLEVEVNIGWTWNDDGCIQQSGTGSTFYSGIGSLVGVQNSYTACTAQCRSWSCENPTPPSVGCLEYPNTGTTNTYSSLTACTADSQCHRYDCGDYGCVVGDHITGTYDTYGDCQTGCTSWQCEDDGCKIYNDIASGTFFQAPGGGTGGTFTTNNCDDICQSYNCNPTWNGAFVDYDLCTLQTVGSGGTFFNPAGVSYSLADCQTGTTAVTACSSWSCEHPLAGGGLTSFGCLNYPNTGNTTTQIMWDSYSACTAQTICERYDCTENGCVVGNQVTGDFASFDECTGGTVANNNTDACQSWGCTSGGTSSGVPCEVFNGPNSVGINENGTLNYVTGVNYGTYGDGGAYNNINSCNVQCKSWNCLDTGCTEQIGYSGGYSNDTCSVTGGIYNVCFSYECIPYSEWDTDSCIIYDGSGSTFFNPAGTSFALDDCHTACTSWSCQNPNPVPSLGCLEYPNTGNTLSQPTYTACTAETVCWRYDCTDNGCVVGSQTGGTYDSLDDCISGTTSLPACQSWQCNDYGCEEYNSPSYPASIYWIDGTYGTGGTNTVSMVDCNLNCRSYSCEDYGCEQHGGTGQTYPSIIYANEQSVWNLCVDNCKSWDCIDVGANWQYGIGCQIYNEVLITSPWDGSNINGYGTGGTYTGATCDSGCTSWKCQGMGTFGCSEFPNTASTYSSYTSCTANTECKSYDCDVTGCVERNWMYMGGIDSYSAMSSCTEVCVGWACIRDVVATGSSIYAYYDISNLSFDNILNMRINLKNYVASNYPTFAGNIYHTIVSDGRWLDWTNSIYNNKFSVSPGAQTLTSPSEWEPTPYHDERALHGIKQTSLLNAANSGNWYDQYSAGTYTNIGTSSGNIATLTTHGIAPTANTSNNVIVINLISEADGIVDNSTLSIVSTIHGYHDSTYVGAPTGNPIMINQPMTEWKEDYTAYTENYNTVSGASGSIRALLYPVRVASSTPGAVVFNPDSAKMCLLQSYAAIASGNQNDVANGGTGTQDGTWLPGKAPRPVGQGGIINGIPELCWQNLNQLESANPYWTTTTPTWGGLDMSGWTVNIQGSYLGSTNFAGFLDDYLISTVTLSAGTCISAETLYTASVAYSYSSDTVCDTGCTPTMYMCTTTGCTLDWSGYLTLWQCQNKCRSVSCTDDGCRWWNSPNTTSPGYVDGNYGSGGTWSGIMGSGMMADCEEVCISTSCNGYPSNPTQQGCIQQLGTGGTWTGINSFTACTGTCMSWECDDPCQYQTALYTISSGGTGCVEWPNTGATHIELTACTATCQENYYCITGLTADTCSTLIDTTIISSDIVDHIDAISTSINPNWTNTRFDELKFILTNVITPPTNACYDNTNNGYWVYITDIKVVVQVGTTIPETYNFLDWNDLVGAMTFHLGGVVPTEISDILNVPGITVTINQEFCLCTTSNCDIGCTNTSSLPANSSGFYPTYLSAQTTCCPITTWSCVTNTTIDNCDGLITLNGIFDDPEACYNYMSVTPGWAGVNFTNVKCEIVPPGILADCEIGPNNGQLIKLTGITTTIPVISSTVHTSWTGFTASLQALSPSVTIPSQANTLITWLITQLQYPGVVFTYGWLDCECDNPYTCECVEIAGSGGTYTSQTLCEEACCSASTWNCVQDQPYLPVCQDKEYLGMAAGTGTYDLNYYRVNYPSTLFGLSKWTINGATSPLFSAYTATQVNDLMAGSGNGDFCFRNMGNNIWYAYWYIYSVSHEFINPGTEYQTWNDFYNATVLIVTACTPSDSVSTIEGKINAHMGISAYTIDVNWKPCCNPSPCYCYDTLTTGGDYANENICDIACCPPEDELSWICTGTTYSDGIPLLGASCQFGYYGAPSLDSINGTPGVGPWNSIGQCQTLDLECAKSWKCSVLTPPPLPCFGQPCEEIPFHYTVTNAYPTEYSCNTNTDLDCCGPEYLWICVSSETTTTMSGLTTIPGNAGTLGYHTSDEVLTYLADPTVSPTNQYSAITAFTFCKFETATTVLNAAEESCKCGDGCDGILASSDYIVFNDLLSGAGSNGVPYHPVTNPQGYCITWADMITQLNTVWDPTGTLGVTLNDTFNDVVTATTNVIGNVITISISGLESCVDITGPCGCEPCYTPNCGTSKDDCNDICCQPIAVTWTCTMNGCLDVCNGLGEFTSKTECTEVCYEWGCGDDVWGCTDSGATNYNPLATIDDGTCVYPTNRWSCRNSQSLDGCSGRTSIGGGLSFTAAIYSIVGNSVYHSVEFSTLKYDLGGGNNQMLSNDDLRHQLPTEPCSVPCPPGVTGLDCLNGFANWGQPGPYYAYIKYVMYSGLPNVQYTTWSSFIDAINLLGYTFTYYNSWQDLEAVLGTNQLHCEWTWCDCGDGCNCVPDANGPYTSELGCDSDTNNCCESWNCETTYDTNSCSGKTDIGFSTLVLWPDEPLEFMVNNGYQYTDVNTLKWIFNNPAPATICTINNNTQHWSHYVDISVGNITLGSTIVQTWDDAITWLNSNLSLGLSSTMPYSVVMNILSNNSSYINPNLGVCYCTGIDCECIEVFDGSGLYRTSGECSTTPNSCCTPVIIPESYDCDCITTTGSGVLGSSCANKNTIPQQAFTNTNAANVNSIIGYIADAANGIQNTNVTDIRYVLDNAATLPYPCTDTAPIATPNSIWAWNRLTNVGAMLNVNPNGNTGILQDTSWAGLINQLVTEGVQYNGTLVNLQMTNTQVFAGINQNGGNGGLTYGYFYCSCTPSTTACNCVDPGNGSGAYNSMFNCQNDVLNLCYTGTSAAPCASQSACLGTTSIPDNNFESYLESNLGTGLTFGLVNGVQIPHYNPDVGYTTWPTVIVVSSNMGNGTNGDGIVLNSNICCVTRLELQSQNISSLTGIEGFVELGQLECDHNQITSLDVSSNVWLINLYCNHNNLTTLTVGNNPILRNLLVAHNSLTTIDLSNVPILRQLSCGRNYTVTSLDFSDTTLLEYLVVDHNLLTNIDVTMLSILKRLTCQANQLTTLDVTQNIDLIDLACGGNQLTTLDVTQNIDLTSLNMHQNPISTIDLSNNLNLEKLTAGWCPLTSLDLTNNTLLTGLMLHICSLTSLNVTNNTALYNFSCSNNQISVLDLSQNTNLHTIVCTTNNMSSLYLGSVLDLNQLTTFEATNNPNLTIHVGTAQRVIDFQNIFIAGTHYDVGINITI